MAFRGHGLLCVPGVDILPDSKVGSKRRFQLVLIKPSHYDDDGYVIRWWRALIPSNSLAAVYGLALDCARAAGARGRRRHRHRGHRRDQHPREHPEADPPLPQARQFRSGRPGRRAVEPVSRARSISRGRSGRPAFRWRSAASTCPAACRCSTASAIDLERRRDMGISLFAGEAEGRLDAVLHDAAAGQAQAALQLHERPAGDRRARRSRSCRIEYVERTLGTNTSFDAGRGCPFQCSFCTIINVQGRKSRFRTPDDVERIVRDNWAQGITRFFITDDNFARNKEWEAIFDRLIELREVDRIPLGIMIQVDTLCHKIPNFIEKAKQRRRHPRVHRAGEHQPRQSGRGQEEAEQDHRIPQDAARLEGARHLHLCRIHPRLPGDTPESIRRDIEIIQRELPLDLLEFFILTPLPGFGGPQDPLEQEASTWMPTSTSTIWSTSSRITRR